MKKELKGYASFYLGCKIWDTKADEGEEVCTLTAVSVDFGIMTLADEHGNFDIKPEDVKLILRTTQSITKDEWDKAPKGSLHIGLEGCFYSPEFFKYLLTLHIDLFGLIDAGIAIDATTIKAEI